MARSKHTLSAPLLNRVRAPSMESGPSGPALAHETRPEPFVDEAARAGALVESILLGIARVAPAKARRAADLISFIAAAENARVRAEVLAPRLGWSEADLRTEVTRRLDRAWVAMFGKGATAAATAGIQEVFSFLAAAKGMSDEEIVVAALTHESAVVGALAAEQATLVMVVRAWSRNRPGRSADGGKMKLLANLLGLVGIATTAKALERRADRARGKS